MAVPVELLIELLIELLAEAVLQLAGLALGQGFEALGRRFTGRQDPWRHADGWIASWQALGGTLLLGALCGFVTLAFFPQLALRLAWLQWANLLLSPLLTGLAIERWHAWRQRRAAFARADFMHGTLFALVFAAVRFGFAS